MEVFPRSKKNCFKAVQVLDYVRKSTGATERGITDSLFDGDRRKAL